MKINPTIGNFQMYMKEKKLDITATKNSSSSIVGDIIFHAMTNMMKSSNKHLQVPSIMLSFINDVDTYVDETSIGSKGPFLRLDQHPIDNFLRRWENNEIDGMNIKKPVFDWLEKCHDFIDASFQSQILNRLAEYQGEMMHDTQDPPTPASTFSAKYKLTATQCAEFKHVFKYRKNPATGRRIQVNGFVSRRLRRECNFDDNNNDISTQKQKRRRYFKGSTYKIVKRQIRYRM